MFRNKILFFTAIFLVSANLCFSQSKTVRNLQLDFVRTETLSDGKQNVISGNLFYENNPYTFVFNILKPQVQTNYINQDGTFFQDQSGLYDFSEGTGILNQTCVDILTWFKKDFGMSASGYAPVSSSIEDGNIVTLWQFVKEGNHPLGDIKITTDSKGNFVRLRMYLVSGELYTETTLSDFITQTGFSFPTTINSELYSNQTLYSKTQLKFSKIKFNQLEIPEAFIPYLAKNPEARPSNPVNGIKNPMETAAEPSLISYKVSLSSVLCTAAYSGYKAFITKQDNSACPFSPSCSQYMLQAVSKYGPLGIIVGLERLKRCNQDEHHRNLYEVKNNKHLDPLE